MSIRVKDLRFSAFILWHFLTTPNITQGISIVYNLRIAETTKHHELEHDAMHSSLVGITPFDQFRRKYDGTRESAIGALATALYYTKKFYVRIDGAGAYVSEQKNDVHFQKTQSDDILFSGGYTKRLGERAIITLSGLFGVPTHKDTSLLNVQFGLAHIGLGAQLDGDFKYSQNEKHSVQTALRLIHFFERKTPCTVNESQENVRFKTGNLVDLFIAHHTTMDQQRFECGYNLTMLFDTKVHPHVADIVDKTEFIRSSFYGTYKYKFSLLDFTNTFLLGVSYGFDHKPKKNGEKRIVTLWATWNVHF